MAPDEKPYRVYRGGRTKGRVPAPKGPSRTRPRADGRGYRGPEARPRAVGWRARLRRVRWRRWLPIGFAALLGLVLVWGVASFLSLRSGVADANKRLPEKARAALTPQSGLLTSHSTTILVLGVDNAALPGREGDRHSDSIMLVRTDPKHHRLAYLSIPRDLRVTVPGVGEAKINAAMQSGGPARAIQTVREYTGLPINHVVVVDFAHFAELIDALGGITVNVPHAIVSNRFDCPYPTAAECQQWQGWRFAKGSQHMDGRRALIYSRIRENRLDPAENDLTRTARQQAVTQGVLAKFTSLGALVRMPFKGDSFVKPMATDLSAWQLAELGWVKFRSSGGSALHCRLGGTSSGGSDILPSEDNRNVLAMFEGKSAPQPPAPASSSEPFPPGCAVGHELG
jgi:LCP family protein required for cell wall assembly